MTRAISIGVIGGAAAAVCILDAIEQATVEHPLAAGRITVFEPGRQLWRGRPYQRDGASVRVNIPPAGMSVRLADNGHFERWLQATGQPAGQDSPHYDRFCDATFVPRSVYGDYLEAAADSAIGRLRARGWQIQVIRERVVHAAPSGDIVTLRTQSGGQVTVGYAVLCVGAGHPEDNYGLAGTPGFVTEPYPLAETLAAVEDADEIGVIGSGLTGVDTVLSLAARGYRGRIQLLSRSGVLPAVRQRVIAHSMLHFTAQRFRAAARRGETLTLADLVEVMGAEIDAAGGDRSALAAEIGSVEHEQPIARLRRQLVEVDAPDPGLRILQRAVPVTGPDVWPLLTTSDQLEVLRRRYRTVMSLCCPMPPSSAHRLLALIDSGQLQIVPGLQGITATEDGGFVVRTAAGDRRVGAIVNAVNPSPHQADPSTEPLIDSLVQAGSTVRHPLGGVQVVRATSGLANGEAVSNRLYALGSLASGSLFFTFGMPSIVDRAYDIAHALIDTAASSVQADQDLELPATPATV